MQNSILAGGGLRVRRLFVGAVALCALPAAAMAGDVAPTQDGANKLSDVLFRYVGKDALAVAIEGDHYVVSLDIAKLLAPLAAQGVGVDMAPAKIDLVEQSDGTWRVTRDGYEPMIFSAKESAFAIQVDGYKFDGLFDPAIYGFRSAETKIDKADAHAHAPEFDETITFGPAQATMTGSAAAGGGYSGTVKENVGEVDVFVTPKTDSPQTQGPVSIKLGGLAYDVTFDNIRVRELLDLWAFVVAHPSRPALASDEEALKTKLRALLPLADKLAEAFSAQNIAVDTPKGSVKLNDIKARFGAEKFPSTGDMEIHFAAGAITLPSGLVPAPLSGLVPNSIDINVKYGGYDYAAAAEEAINDLHLAGEGPVISDADREKIPAKMMSGGPIHFTILPSRIVAPQLDVSMEGELQVTGARPVGKVTLKAHNFDSTFAAIKGAGPQIATPQLIAGLTLAKGLGKAEADGVLTWVAEYSADGAIKVNGLALGKAPAQ
jgi:hypothetical protein